MSLSTTDYVIEGFLALLVFVLPWFLRPGLGCLAFGLPFVAIFAWGYWRVFHFDIAMKNDVPGIAYFVAAVPYSLIALFFFKIRCRIVRWKAGNRHRITGDDNSGIRD